MESRGGTHEDGTGLEGPTWQLGLSAGPEPYPERPGGPDCSYYLRTGSCGFGNRCRFNHPRDRSVHYTRTGTCKFGSSCKYPHPRGAGPSPVAFNFHGYPFRPGGEECSYYLKTGRCKFGASCKFHHPQPAGDQLPPPPPVLLPPAQESPPPPPQQYGNFIQIPRAPMLSSSYIPGNYGPMIIPHGIVTFPSWTPYPASDQPTTRYEGHEYPQRPGESECQHYLRTGDCKFGPTCKFHHPPEPKTGPVLGPMGLPLRPGSRICFHYSRNGVCRFGPSCRFDHPMRAISYSSSTSSLTGVPVAPSPTGSMNVAVAPSSSSRLELHGAGDDVASPSKIATSGPMLSVPREDFNAYSSHGV